MLTCRLLVLAALVSAPTLAAAQSAVDRANLAAASGPIVLQVDPDSGRFRPTKPVVPGPGQRIIRAVPVPHVMNGGGYGLSGSDYYYDASSEGRLNSRHRAKEYILAPALKERLP